MSKWACAESARNENRFWWSSTVCEISRSLAIIWIYKSGKIASAANLSIEFNWVKMVSDGKIQQKETFFKVQHKETVGRFATATKTLPAGSIVFEEIPFVIGPNPDTRAVCLECCAPVDGTTDGSRCNKCGWPMCVDCKLNSTRKHHSKECEIFQQNKVKFHNLVTPHQICLQLNCISPLR